MKFSKVLIIFIFSTVIIFTLAMIYLHITTGCTPDTLITCVFSFFGAECGCLSWIKSTEEKNYDRKIELEDRNLNNPTEGIEGE